MAEWSKHEIANLNFVGSIPTRPSMKDLMDNEINLGDTVCWVKSAGGAAVKGYWGTVEKVTDKSVWFKADEKSTRSRTYAKGNVGLKDLEVCSHSSRIVILSQESMYREAMLQMFSWVQYFDEEGQYGHPSDYVSGEYLPDRLREEITQEHIDEFRQ